MLALAFSPISSVSGQSIEQAILARTHSVISEGFDSPQSRLLPNSILEVPIRASHPRFSTYIDLQDGQRLMGDVQDRFALHVTDLDPIADLAIVAEFGGSWRAMQVSSGKALASFHIDFSLAQWALASEGRSAIAVGYGYAPPNVTLQAFDPHTGKERWNLQLPPNSRAELTRDRSLLNVVRADPDYPGGRFLELYNPLDGRLLASADLVDHEAAGAQTLIQMYSNNGRFAFMQRPAPLSAVVVDIEENSIYDLKGALRTVLSDDSRFAILKNGPLWQIVNLDSKSIALSLGGDWATQPVFTGKRDEILYYDEQAHALKFGNLATAETTIALQLPPTILQLLLLASSVDGRYIVLTAYDEKIHIFDRHGGTAKSIPFDTGNFLGYFIDDESERLVAIGVAGNVVSIPLSSPDLLVELTQESAEQVVISTSKNEINVLFRRGRIRRYNASSFEVIGEYVLEVSLADRIYALASDSPTIAFQTGKQLRVVNYETQELAWTYVIPIDTDGIMDASLSASGRYLAIRTLKTPTIEGVTFEIFDTSNSERVFTLDGGAYDLWMPTFSLDEKTLSFGIRDTNQNFQLFTHRLSDGGLESASSSFPYVNQFILSNDGSRAFLASGSSIFAIDLHSGIENEIANVEAASNGGIHSFSISPDASRALVTNIEHEVYLISLHSGETLASATVAWVLNNQYFTYGSGFLAYLPDASGFLFSMKDGAFSSWNILEAARAPDLAITVPRAEPTVQFEVTQGKGYRLLESTDLLNWTSSDPYDGRTAPADAVFSKSLLSPNQTFLQVWEYE